jgi:hypothetical protein
MAKVECDVRTWYIFPHSHDFHENLSVKVLEETLSSQSSLRNYMPESVGVNF